MCQAGTGLELIQGRGLELAVPVKNGLSDKLTDETLKRNYRPYAGFSVWDSFAIINNSVSTFWEITDV